MVFLSLTLKNIKKFVTNHPLMFLFLVLAQIICIVEVYVSCGMAYNMNFTQQTMDNQVFGLNFDAVSSWKRDIIEDENGNFIRCINIPRDDNGKSDEKLELKNAIPIAEAKEQIEQLLSQTKEYKPKSLRIELYENKILDKEKLLATDYRSYYPDLQVPEEYSIYQKSSEKVILAPCNKSNGEHSPLCNFFPGESYRFGGSDYKLVGSAPYNYIPYNALPDDFVVGFLKVEYEEKLTSADIDKINMVMGSVFGIHIKESFTPDAYDPTAVQLSTMLFVISIAVMLIVLLAIAKFYSFILDTRHETLAIMRLCGCTRTKANMIYMAEILITMITTTVAGALLFRFVLFEPIADMYPAFNEFFISSVYWYIAASYLIVAVLILTITVNIATRVSVKEMIK